MAHVFVTYKLRSGVTLEQYMDWSRTTDQRITPTQPGIRGFSVYAIDGAEDGEEPWCQIVEVIDVESIESFKAAVEGVGMKQIVADFPTLADTATAKTIYGQRIEPNPTTVP